MPVKLINPTKADILAATPPQSTRTYKAISHGQIIDVLSEELDKQGFVIVSETYDAPKGNQMVVGHLQLNLNLDSELKFEVAFMNSYNKTKRAVVAGGSQVIVCKNGHILGDTSYGSFRKKHVGTASEDIKVFIPEMIKRASDCFQLLVNQKNQMKQIEVSKRVRNELIGQLYLDEAIIKDTQMSIIKREFDNPSFNYNTDENSLWQAYNNVTLALKQSHPTTWLSDHQKFNQLITNQFQLT